MQEYAQVLMIAIPFFMVLIAVEYAVSRVRGIKVYRGMDTISSLSSGLTNTIKDVLGLVIIILSYSWLVDKLALFDIKSTIWLYVLAFIGKDFAGYWSHRFEHVINIFWNRHIIHHSSEEFNLACALRQPVSNMVAIFTFLYIPMAILGVPARVVAVVAPIHLFMQFWYHTRLIDKLGFLEYILVTPSHHRVHHAINEEYMDRNFSQIFIIWDRLFGTFQKELDEVPAVFGVKRPVQTWNPIVINFKHLWLLIQDAWKTKNWNDKLRIWFMPTGWRPSDVQESYDVYSVKDVYSLEKYDSQLPISLEYWSYFQLVFHSVLMLYMFSQFGQYSFSLVFLYGLFLLVSIFAFTSLMDRSIIALIAEGFKLIIGGTIFYMIQGWFGIEEMIPFGSSLMVIYLFISFTITLYYLVINSNTKKYTAIVSN